MKYVHELFECIQSLSTSRTTDLSNLASPFCKNMQFHCLLVSLQQVCFNSFNFIFPFIIMSLSGFTHFFKVIKSPYVSNWLMDVIHRLSDACSLILQALPNFQPVQFLTASHPWPSIESHSFPTKAVWPPHPFISSFLPSLSSAWPALSAVLPIPFQGVLPPTESCIHCQLYTPKWIGSKLQQLMLVYPYRQTLHLSPCTFYVIPTPHTITVWHYVMFNFNPPFYIINFSVP